MLFNRMKIEYSELKIEFIITSQADGYLCLHNPSLNNNMRTRNFLNGLIRLRYRHEHKHQK